MNQGRTLLAQVMELLPRRAFDAAVTRYRRRGRAGRFSAMDQLICMVFAQVSGRQSLRDTVTCLRALGRRAYHCGIRTTPSRSTLARVNEQNDYRIFMDTALAMIERARLVLPGDPELRRLRRRSLYAIDSTTIDLCLKLFPWAAFKRRKGAIKAHVMTDLHTGVPVFMRISNGKESDVALLDRIVFVAGAFYAIDRAYLDVRRLHRLHRQGAFFVTRARRDMIIKVRRRLPTPTRGNVTHDQVVQFGSAASHRAYPDRLRRVRFTDPQTGRRLVFLTNNFTLSASSIALLYRKRWQIELLFKWMKQHLRIKSFFGTSVNAVKSQLWIAVIAYVLILHLKARWQLPQTPNEIAQILGVLLLEKTPINQAFLDLAPDSPEPDNRNQLQLFEM